MGVIELIFVQSHFFLIVYNIHNYSLQGSGPG